MRRRAGWLARHAFESGQGGDDSHGGFGRLGVCHVVANLALAHAIDSV